MPFPLPFPLPFTIYPIPSIYFYVVPAALTLLCLIFQTTRIKKDEYANFSSLGFLSAIGWAVLVWVLTHNWLLTALSLFYAYAVIYYRWAIWLRYGDKLLRPIYYLLVDAVLLAVLYFVMTWAHGAWWYFIAAPLAMLFSAGIMIAIFTRIRPIMMAEDNLFSSGSNPDLRRQNRQLIIQYRLGWYRKQIASAQEDRNKGRPEAVREKVKPIISELEELGTSNLVTEQKNLLGQAYLLRAWAEIQVKKPIDAALSLSKGRIYVAPDFELISSLADAAADGASFPSAVEICIQYLKGRSESPFNDLTLKVSNHLSRQCEISEKDSKTRITQAEQLASQVTAAEPRFAWSHRVTGQCHFINGKWQPAVEALEQALTLAPTNSITQYYLGLAYVNLNLPAKAYPHLKDTLQSNSKQPKAAYHLGLILLEAYQKKQPLTTDRAQDLKQAVSWLEAACELEPRNAAYHYDLARADQLADRPAQAIQELQTVIRLEPGNIPAHRLLADLLYEKGDFTAAIPHYRKAQPHYQQDSNLALHLGHCLVEIHEDSEAIELLHPLAEKNNKAVLWSGRAHLHLRHFKIAADLLESFARQDNSSAAAFYYLGCALAWLGKTEDASHLRTASTWFGRSLELNDPLWIKKSHLQLGHISLMRECLDDAIQYYQLADSSENEIEAGLGLARSYMANGIADKAQQVLTPLASKYNEDRRVHLLLGLIYESQNQMDLAEKEYRNASATGALGVILYLRGQTGEAVKMIKQARQGGDNSDRLLYFSGLARASAQDYQSAISEWDLLSTRHPEDNRLKLNISRAWYLLGCQHYKNGELGKTAEAWEKFYTFYNADDEVRQNLGNLYLQIARQNLGKSGAETALMRARELKVDADTCDTILALHRIQSSDLPGAANLLTRLNNRLPQNAPIAFNLGVVLMNQEKNQPALSYLRTAAESSDRALGHQGAWALAAAHANLGDWAKAADLVSKELDL